MLPRLESRNDSKYVDVISGDPGPPSKAKNGVAREIQGGDEKMTKPVTTPATRRDFLKTTALGAAALSSGGRWNLVKAAPNEPAKPKKLIAWGGIDWYSPETVQINIRKIEELPFDGTVLQGFKSNSDPKVMFDWLCFGQQKLEREQFTDIIATIKNTDFQRFTNNLLRVNVTPGDADWFDDFGPILHNAAWWAQVTKEVGCPGWAFDIEDYKGTVFNYAKMKYKDTKSFEEYAEQVRKRGREYMSAVQEANPEIVLLAMLGHSYVNRTPQARDKLPELEYGLMPAFLDGMIEVVERPARIIDGHEQSYGYFTDEDFSAGLKSTRKGALALVPPELHEKYQAHMEVGMAIYVNYTLHLEGVARGPSEYLTPEERLQLFEHNIYYALDTTDEYAWCYGERIGWWEEGHPVALPKGALEAIRSARAKFDAGVPLGFDMTERIAQAKATMEAERKKEAGE